MKGSNIKLAAFLDGAEKRFVIPVYQRKYDWREEQCGQLFEDLKSVAREKRGSHFFGSLVFSEAKVNQWTEYCIIDGQKRLTTVTLLLLAILKLLEREEPEQGKRRLGERIRQFLISPDEKWEERIKLRPVQGDREALRKLFGAEEDFDRASKLTINYEYFLERLRAGELTVDEACEAIGKLEVVTIELEPGDDAQRIFESLNSTGLALNEGDKIRNFLLMGLDSRKQDEYYHGYWLRIEECTSGEISGFMRTYLSIQNRSAPKVNDVYSAFRAFARERQMDARDLLEDLLGYARLFKKVQTAQSELHQPLLDDCLRRLKQMDIGVTLPFLMEVLRLQKESKLAVRDVLSAFQMVETYLFRRSICDLPSSSLGGIFLKLNGNVLECDGTAERYLDKLAWALLSRRGDGRFPDDKEFIQAISTRPLYQVLHSRFKAYLFERLENYGTVETKDVYAHLRSGTYTIEHIMPQHLTPAWEEALGPDCEEIHNTWQHRLANLTLTGYNSKLSNNTFQEKRDGEGGYRDSGLRMNQRIARQEHWGLEELRERNAELMERAKEIWPMPKTAYRPKVEIESCSLDDESIDLTGRGILGYAYRNVSYRAGKWVNMYEQMLRFLHERDKSVLIDLANSASPRFLGFIAGSAEDMHQPLEIGDGVYVECKITTSAKLSILRELFPLYAADPADLVFYLKDREEKGKSESKQERQNRQYWTYALPLIQQQNAGRGSFDGVEPGALNYIAGPVGVEDCNISCVAKTDCAYVNFMMNKPSPLEGSAAFELLSQHREEILRKAGASLYWGRGNGYPSAWIGYRLSGVSIANEADWQRMAQFHAEWSDRLCAILLPYLGGK